MMIRIISKCIYCDVVHWWYARRTKIEIADHLCVKFWNTSYLWDIFVDGRIFPGGIGVWRCKLGNADSIVRHLWFMENVLKKCLSFWLLVAVQNICEHSQFSSTSSRNFSTDFLIFNSFTPFCPLSFWYFVSVAIIIIPTSDSFIRSSLFLDIVDKLRIIIFHWTLSRSFVTVLIERVKIHSAFFALFVPTFLNKMKKAKYVIFHWGLGKRSIPVLAEKVEMVDTHFSFIALFVQVHVQEVRIVFFHWAWVGVSFWPSLREQKLPTFLLLPSHRSFRFSLIRWESCFSIELGADVSFWSSLQLPLSSRFSFPFCFTLVMRDLRGSRGA